MANLVAARLAAVNIPVSMLGTWPEGVAALKDRGVRLVLENGDETAYPVNVISGNQSEIKVDRAFVLVKSWQTERAARQLAKILTPDGIALTLQNGLGNRKILTDILGKERVALGVTTMGATLLSPGRVRPGGEGKISLEAHPQIDRFISILVNAGFAVETTLDVDALIWGKLVVNAAINPLTALLKVTNGNLLTSTSSRTVMGLLAKETVSVAQALGVNLPFGDPVPIVEDVARRTAHNRSSMLQDIIRGAPTEIDAICGAIVGAGKDVGVPTPVNHFLWLLVTATVDQKMME
jgi:2-dehydropantoate 2-reductase